ncbi:crotonase/enoyl-CoA hydratase family protein [Hydrogenophaga sp.]|uniref:crotonase/enoyl-CoA hydratase family protein n=1 Tax=Hydrogenophaga sp. TaxID=1904254 RepID=UPI00271E0E9B|nr:crotonase/enoyl-CoA hydratase family protein [Hydrogenophaga sp.]MDO9433956.1 crotonase/enoyl-CoA hydratase family protein [Hydrogenophaga sp.]
MTPHFTTPPPNGCIDVEAVGPVLLIGLNRPAKRNGVTPRMLRELAQAYTQLDDDPHLRVAVLHAAGDHFTGGIDLPAMAEFHQRGEKPVPRDAGLVDPLDLDLPGYRRRNKPVVVAVQGICFTIGIELMLAADMVVAADNSRFAQMEVGRGIIAASGATLRMAERAGMGNAMRLLLTGMEFNSAEALRLNFVQEVVPAGTCFARASTLAESIAAQAPQAVVATRLNVRKSVVEGMSKAVAELLEVQKRLALTEDAAEGRRSFTEKRAPVFTGR